MLESKFEEARRKLIGTKEGGAVQDGRYFAVVKSAKYIRDGEYLQITSTITSIVVGENDDIKGKEVTGRLYAETKSGKNRLLPLLIQMQKAGIAPQTEEEFERAFEGAGAHVTVFNGRVYYNEFEF